MLALPRHLYLVFLLFRAKYPLLPPRLRLALLLHLWRLWLLVDLSPGPTQPHLNPRLRLRRRRLLLRCLRWL